LGLCQIHNQSAVENIQNCERVMARVRVIIRGTKEKINLS
jgi:hypothetical protein